MTQQENTNMGRIEELLQQLITQQFETNEQLKAIARALSLKSATTMTQPERESIQQGEVGLGTLLLDGLGRLDENVARATSIASLAHRHWARAVGLTAPDHVLGGWLSCWQCQKIVSHRGERQTQQKGYERLCTRCEEARDREEMKNAGLGTK